MNPEPLQELGVREDAQSKQLPLLYSITARLIREKGHRPSQVCSSRSRSLALSPSLPRLLPLAPHPYSVECSRG